MQLVMFVCLPVHKIINSFSCEWIRIWDKMPHVQHKTDSKIQRTKNQQSE